MLRINSQIIFTFAFFLLFSGQEPAIFGQQRQFIPEEFRIHRNFHSKFLIKARDIIVWLPPGYESESAKRYPVLYMHDGVSVFNKWHIDEIAKPLIASRQIEPLIIVMVSNGGSQNDRFDDYTPTRMSNLKSGGKADFYGQMLVEELKPLIDSQFRTLPDAPNTALGGTSLGGLVSLYLGLKHPTVFGKLAVMSPSVWWDGKLIVRKVKALSSKPSLRIWLDIGKGEGSRAIGEVKELRDALVKKGWVLDSDLMYFEDKRGTHDEESFKKRAEPMLKYLFLPTLNSGSRQ